MQNEMQNPDFAFIEEDWAGFLKEKETWIRRCNSAANKASRALGAAIDKLGLDGSLTNY